MIMLVARVEERLGKRVSMAELFEDPTIEHLAGLIGHGKEALYQSLIVPLRAEGTRPALFGPHASGGHVWCYKELVQFIGDDQPFFGVQAREPENGMVVYHNDIESMATDYVEALRAFQPEGPYWLAGWSIGGVIAYEMACQLQQQDQEVALLALIDAGVPETQDRDYHWASLLSVFAYDLGLTQENFKRPASALPQMAQLRQLWVEARRAGAVPSEMTLVEFRKVFDTFKIYANTMRRYRPKPFNGTVTLFCPGDAVEQIAFVPDTAEHVGEKQLDLDPVKGWGEHASNGVEVHYVPGNHFSMLREPNVQALGEKLRHCIDEALNR
jgi:thioesterase domain-containing protein